MNGPTATSNPILVNHITVEISILHILYMFHENHFEGCVMNINQVEVNFI